MSTSVTLFHTTEEYVKHIYEIERCNCSTLVASSFLPSHLFSKSIIHRYFARQTLGTIANSVADILWSRRKLIHNNLKKLNYSEMYELDSIDKFCGHGIVHRQSSSFQATPKEIIETLDVITTLLFKHSTYKVALCKETLPFVFIVKLGNGFTIDVRNNFVYQGIQGMHIQDKDAEEQFTCEFNRIWNAKNTMSETEQVLKYLQEKKTKIKKEWSIK